MTPGDYTLVSFQRPCQGNCTQLDPPTDRCEQPVTLAGGQTVSATVVLDRSGCIIRTAAPQPSHASAKPRIASVEYGKHRPPGAERSFYGLRVRAQDPDGQIVSMDVAPVDGSAGDHADGGCGLGSETTGETETWYLPTGRLEPGTYRYRVTVQSSSCDAANRLQETTETFTVRSPSQG